MKRFLTLVFVTFYVVGWSQNQSQREIDSLVKIVSAKKSDTAKCTLLNRLSRLYIYKNPEVGISYANSALALSNRLKFEDGKGVAYLNLGMHEVSKGNYDLAQSHLTSAEKILSKTQNVAFLARTNNELGILKANQGNFPVALDYFFKALRLYEKLDPEKSAFSRASSYENIGTVYNLTESFPKAITHYKKAVKLLETLQDHKLELGLNLANLGTIYQRQGDFKLALKTYSDASKILDREHDVFANAFVKSWTGSAFLEMREFDKSLAESKSALVDAKLTKDKQLTTTTIQNIGRAYLEKGIFRNDPNALDSAKANLKLSLKMHKELGNHEGLIKDYLYLSRYFKFGNDFKNALDAHEKSAAYVDSVFNFKNKQSLQNLEDQRTIELRNKEIQISKLAIDNKEKQKWYLIAAISLLAVIGLLLYNQSRNRRKTNQKLQTLNENLQEANRVKTKFFSILNHDLRAPVARLISFMRLQKESPELFDDQSRTRLENQTMTSAENLLESMEDMLLWAKGQMENFHPKSRKTAVSQLFSEVAQQFGDGKTKLAFEHNSLSVETDPDYLKTIIRNLTANAIKALETTENPKIQWVAFVENGQTKLSISDNGPGASHEQFKALYDEKEVIGIKSGLGLHLIRDLASAINCTISVSSELEKGTTFKLSFANLQV
ncbi:tetratricopeptide repeat-containing sensor histidine kinase [Flavobacterium sp.]|uniref:tetratricopeptide repeat-containing sensor histidine kinase n=1 Tax=Flavobacterium sp. TaxID=239 RepID=UPI001218FCCD|nr:tetratricopeptide repeat-containing sensor histidine kinase [Flavobacterium sp.]RZJ69358.1 MAG: sensor histidine kinase [Flavobacterium sp.]